MGFSFYLLEIFQPPSDSRFHCRKVAFCVNFHNTKIYAPIENLLWGCLFTKPRLHPAHMILKNLVNKGNQLFGRPINPPGEPVLR